MKKVSLKVFILFAAVIMFFANCKDAKKTIIVDNDLIIKVSEITEKALFFPMEIEGVRMEVLAVKAPDNTIRTALNTCEVCYPSGRGFFVQVNTELVCQNCGRRFQMSQVEEQIGGCHPVGIFPENKTVTEKTITISKEFLAQNKVYFESMIWDLPR